MIKQPNYVFDDETELYHHGILGQKWGDRRFQNEDGSWTPEGRERYGKGGREEARAKIQYVKEKAKNLYTKVKSKIKEKTGDGLERTKDMSDDDLQKAVNRFKLQAEYNKNYELAKHPNAALAKADRFFEGATGKMVRDVAVATIPNAVNTTISKILDKGLNKESVADKALDIKQKKANIEQTLANIKKTKAEAKEKNSEYSKTIKELEIKQKKAAIEKSLADAKKANSEATKASSEAKNINKNQEPKAENKTTIPKNETVLKTVSKESSKPVNSIIKTYSIEDLDKYLKKGR